MSEGIKEAARKRMADPEAEALVSHKEVWNHHASQLIWKLIAFKKGLNGRGDAEAGIPPSHIKSPLPSEVSGLLSELAAEYGSLMQDAGGIIHQQDEFSQHHLQASHIDETIIVLAELEAQAGLFDFGKRVGKSVWKNTKKLLPDIFLRKSLNTMRTNCGIVRRQLKRVQEDVLSSGTDGIHRAFYTTKSLGWKNLIEGWGRIQRSSPDVSSKVEFIKSLISLKPILSDVDNVYSLSGVNGFVVPNIDSIKEFVKQRGPLIKEIMGGADVDEEVKKDLIDAVIMFIDLYRKALAAANQHFNTKANTAADIIVSQHLEKAAGPVGRWMKKKRLELTPFKSDIDQTKLYTSEYISLALQGIKDLKEAVEDGDEEAITKRLSETLQALADVYERVADLGLKLHDANRMESLDVKKRVLTIALSDISFMRRTALEIRREGEALASKRNSMISDMLSGRM